MGTLIFPSNTGGISVTPNPQEIYVDANVGDDTTGTGSVVAPYKTIQHAVTFCTDPTKIYTLILACANYTGADSIIPGNVNIEGNGASIQFNLTLGSVGLVGFQIQPFYVTCGFQEFTFDLSPFSIALPTFDNCGIAKLIRTDTSVGAYIIRFSDGSCTDFSIKGNVAFDNTLFVGLGTVETGGVGFFKNTIIGIPINLDAGSQAVLLSDVFVAPGGVLNALDPSVIINIDSTSASGFGGTIVGTTNINYLDNAQTIKYIPTTPANWSTVPDTVQEGLDELSSVISSSVTGVSATSPITSTGGTTPDISTSMNTNKLIGRGTPGVGVMEEITLGTGLSLTGTTLDATGGGLKSGTATGTNTYAVTITGVTSYTDGDAYIIEFTNGNDADSTIDINGLGVKTLVKEFNVQITGGDIVSGQVLLVVYDGTNFQCIGVAPNQLFAYVTNADSVTINKGQPVYAFGASGNRMSVKLANNTSDATSAQTVGVVFSTSIAPNQRGFIITQGVISGLNTGMYSAGNQLYLGATAGSLTNVKPYAPNHLVYIGIVERANAGNGQIYIKPQNGYELDEIHDVDIISTPPTDGQVLTYDSVTGLWRNESLPNTTLTSAGGTETLVNDGTGPSLATKGITAGTGISLSSTATELTVTNSAPDQTVVLNAGTGIGVTGTYPNFTISNTDPGSGGAGYSATLNFQTQVLATSASNTTYVIGGNANYAPNTLANDSPRYRVRTPIGGSIKSVQFSIYIQGTFAGSGNVTLRVVNVTQNTSADLTTTYLMSSGVLQGGARNDHFVLITPLAVTAGDEIQIRLITPTWITAPTNIFHNGQVYITN